MHLGFSGNVHERISASDVKSIQGEPSAKLEAYEAPRMFKYVGIDLPKASFITSQAGA